MRELVFKYGPDRYLNVAIRPNVGVHRQKAMAEVELAFEAHVRRAERNAMARMAISISIMCSIVAAFSELPVKALVGVLFIAVFHVLLAHTTYTIASDAALSSIEGPGEDA